MSKLKKKNFILWFINQAGSHLATEKSSEELYKMILGRRGQDKEVSSKEWVVLGKVIFFGEQQESIRWITSLVLTNDCWPVTSQNCIPGKERN